MTKGLPSTTFPEFRSSLCVDADPSTAGGVEYHIVLGIGLHVLSGLYL
jgi:hypothetical protein